jgi:hypothetical protein
VSPDGASKNSDWMQDPTLLDVHGRETSAVCVV